MTIREILSHLTYGPAAEAAEPAIRWLESRGGRVQLFIGNAWVEPTGGEYVETVNPATGKPLARVARAGPEDVDAAVRAATEALETWRRLPGSVRARFLRALARRVESHARLLAVLETLNSGKAVRVTRDVDVPLVARSLHYHAGWAHLVERVFPGREPVGVCAVLVPWNSPLRTLAAKVAPALAAGCTVVLKPSAHTPLSAIAFCELAQEAGLPPGVVNAVTGDVRVAEWLVDHPGVGGIAFTGSVEAGRAIRRRTAGTGKALSLVLRSPYSLVVFEDADLDGAAEGVVEAVWSDRDRVSALLLVQESVADRFFTRLRSRMEALRVGDPLDVTVDLGPIPSPAHLEALRRLCETGAREGARIWQPSGTPEEGLFFPPTLATDVAPSMTLAQAELCGPVALAMTFRTPQEAVTLANHTRFGLASSVWSQDVDTALDVARQIRAGVVWVNGALLFDPSSEFGGDRESGSGREGGWEGVREYLRPASGPAELPPPQVGSSGPAGGGAAFVEPWLFIGGKRVPSASGSLRPVYGPDGRRVGEVPDGHRKDLRNAVEAARAAVGAWQAASAQTRARILWELGEHIESRAAEFTRRIAATTGSEDRARAEVERSGLRLFAFAAHAERQGGLVHPVHPPRHLVVAVRQPLGVIGIVAPDRAPLLAFVTLLGAALAGGNTVVAVPSEAHPLAAVHLVDGLRVCEVPPGVVNVVTGRSSVLATVLAQHDDVDAVWCFGPSETARSVELESAGNLKRTWVQPPPDWWEFDEEEALRQATRIQNIWIPYGA